MTFSTCRSKWTLGDVAVDVDEASFGFSLAEFEILCSSADEIPSTLDRIDQLCERLGVHAKGAPQGLGKMEMFALLNPDLKERVLRFAPQLIARFLA
jgi:hypothetical protein